MTDVLLACSVCGTVTPAQQAVYLGSTGFLSFLPLIFIAGLVMWVVRESRRSSDQAIRQQDQSGSSSEQGASDQAAGHLPIDDGHGAHGHAQHHAHRDNEHVHAVNADPIHFNPGIRPGGEEPCPS